MGQKMVDIFDAVQKEAGTRGQMRLAMITGVTSNNAKDTPDTPDKLAKFASAFKEITQKECPIK